MVLTVTGSPTGVPVGGTSTITADLTHNNLGEDTSSLGFVPDGIPVNFNVLNPLLGFVNPINSYTVNGTVSSLFNSLTTGLETVNVTVDSQTLQQQFKMGTVDLLVRNYEWYPNRDNNYSFAEAAPYVSYVMNFGPDTATNIIVKYTIGTGLIYQGYSLITGGIDKVTYDGQNLTYTINNLPANGIAIILIYLQTNATGTQTDPTNNHSITNICRPKRKRTQPQHRNPKTNRTQRSRHTSNTKTR